MARRRIGAPSTIRTVFSVLWIALGCLSVYYLFTLFTGAAPAVSRTAQMAAPAASAPSTPAPAAQPGLSAEQLGVIENNLQTLSRHLAALDKRLQPIESFIGPAAKLPSSNSVSTSAPRPLIKLEPLPKAAPAVSAAPSAPAPPAAPNPATAPKPEAAAELGDLLICQRLLASKMHAPLLGFLNSIHLSFCTNLRLELRNRTQHVEQEHEGQQNPHVCLEF